MLSVQKKALKTDNWTGAIITLVIASLWIATLVGSFQILVPNCSWIWIICSILIRTYLHTGLFILAHESMHGNLIPPNQRLNKTIGCLMLGIYGLLPYDRCFVNHINHHRYPSQSGDPDFHGDAANPIHWYCKFMSEYFPLRLTFLPHIYPQKLPPPQNLMQYHRHLRSSPAVLKAHNNYLSPYVVD